MCIRDRYQRRVRGERAAATMTDRSKEFEDDVEPSPLVEMSLGTQPLRERSLPPGGSKCSVRADLRSLSSMLNPRNNKISVLLVFVPLGMIASPAGMGGPVVFFLNFLAIVPLAWMLGEATESIACYTGQTLGGLLNATFGNAVEMILSVFALKKGLVRVVQGSLLGSVLSNLLLVLGMAFFMGGYYYSEQKFNATGAGANSTLLMLSAFAMVIPAIFVANYPEEEHGSALAISHSAAVVLGLMYIQFLFFQLKTHKQLFENDEEDEEDEEEEEAPFSMGGSIGILFGVTIIVAVCSEALVGSIEALTEEWGISEAFVGIILLPIVGNAAEHVTAITMAMKNKTDLAIGVAVGSSTQISLFVVPFTVIAGWMMDVEMTLDFKTFETSVMVMTVLITMSVISDGKSNWLEGSVLMCTYLLVAVAFWYMPDEK
eukprot:TRINITY_DN13761_c0_g1_i1.p1 TRINITY_DN13761_c0_g1~~TRINITY_DN13761_c0_g1_i1.p1  ORF type:complete len:431 (-),score=154.34 TRINITY_DN13761_c0_g1_i1:210-1502(-)